MIKNLFARIHATLPGGESDPRLPHKVARHHTSPEEGLKTLFELHRGFAGSFYLAENDAPLEAPSYEQAPCYPAHLMPFWHVHQG